MDKVRNDVEREELNAESIIGSIERQILKWFNHVVEMGEENYDQKDMAGKISGEENQRET